MSELIEKLRARAQREESVSGDDWMCPTDPIFRDTINEITRLRRERDEWHEDRDRVLKDQMLWMEMVEAVYPDRELDFGEALALIIKERGEWGGLLDETETVAQAFHITAMTSILYKRGGE